MFRHPTARLLALCLALSLAACAAYQAQHQAAAPRPAEPEQAAVTVRPSGEFSELAPDLQVARVRAEAEEAKANLARQGRYSCCIHPSCNECLHKYGQCHCREAVRKEGPCCGECTEGWLEGKGTVEGVTAWEILERKKKVLEEENRKGSEEKEPAKPPEQRHQHHHH